MQSSLEMKMKKLTTQSDNLQNWMTILQESIYGSAVISIKSAIKTKKHGKARKAGKYPSLKH